MSALMAEAEDSPDDPFFVLSLLPHEDGPEDEDEAKDADLATGDPDPSAPLLRLPAEQLQRHHLPSTGATLLLRQIPSRGLSFQLWPAASTLVSLLDCTPSTLRLPAPQTPPLRVLELGSGTGLVGIAAAAALGARATLTDLPHVLPNLRFNAESNSAAAAARGGSLVVRQLRWGHPGDAAALAADGEAFDAMLASDVVYYEELIDPLLRTLEVFVKGEVVFVMAHLRRWKKRDSVFFRKARKLFNVTVIHTDPPLPGSRHGVAVYHFMARGERLLKNRTKKANEGSSYFCAHRQNV